MEGLSINEGMSVLYGSEQWGIKSALQIFLNANVHFKSDFIIEFLLFFFHVVVQVVVAATF